MRALSLSSGLVVSGLCLLVSACLPTEVCACVLVPEIAVSGTVLDADEQPVGEVRVTLLAAGGGQERAEGVTGADGRFILAIPVLDTLYDLHIEPPAGYHLPASDDHPHPVRLQVSGRGHIDVPPFRIENEEILLVAPALAECVGAHGPERCLRIRRSSSAPWELWYGAIDGFDFEEGYAWTLRVARGAWREPPADASTMRYRLLEVLEKTRADTASAGR